MLYNFQRLHLTRAYWLAQAIMLYADLCDVAAPVLVQHDWEEIIATAEARLRPLSEEADRRYQQVLRRGIHPGLLTGACAASQNICCRDCLCCPPPRLRLSPRAPRLAARPRRPARLV